MKPLFSKVRWLLAAAIVATLPTVAQADDEASIAGPWKFVVMMDDGQELESSVKIKKDEDGELAAAYTMANPFTGEDVSGEVKGIEVDGNDVTLTVEVNLEGISLTADFNGTLEGDKIKGNVAYDLDGQTGELPFEGIRVKPNVLGKWEMVAMMDGQEIPTTLTILEKDGKLEASFVGMDGSEGKVEEIKLEGDQLTAQVGVDFQGLELKITFNGTVDGDEINGTVNYDLDGQTGELDLAGKRVQPEVVGTWKLVAMMDGQEIPATLKIAEGEDGELTATFIGADGTEAKVGEIQLDGSELTGNVEVDFQGLPLKLDFRGVVVDDQLTGSLTYDLEGQIGELDLTGEMQKLNPVGKWEFTVVTDDGQELVSTIAIAEEDGKLVGTFTAMDGSEGEVKEIAVSGSQLATTVEIDFEGTPLKATFEGDVEGDKIAGVVNYDLGGQTGELEFSGTRKAEACEKCDKDEACEKDDEDCEEKACCKDGGKECCKKKCDKDDENCEKECCKDGGKECCKDGGKECCKKKCDKDDEDCEKCDKDDDDDDA